MANNMYITVKMEDSPTVFTATLQPNTSPQYECPNHDCPNKETSDIVLIVILSVIASCILNITITMVIHITWKWSKCGESDVNLN